MKIELRRQVGPEDAFELRITQRQTGRRFRGSPEHKFACGAEGLHDVALNSRLRSVRFALLTARGGHTSGIVISNLKPRE